MQRSSLLSAALALSAPSVQRHVQAAARLALGAAAMVALNACARPEPAAQRVVLIADDPAARDLSNPAAVALLQGASAQGLVGFDAEGKIVPALAERWIVADDGQSYIFRLRQAHWPDGTKLTGESVAAAFRGAMANVRGTALALDLSVVLDCRAMTGRVVEIRLRRPMPDFLLLLAQPEMGLLRHQAGAGPMRLRREDQLAWLTPIIPEKPDQALPEAAASTPVTLSLRNTTRALAQVTQGEADLVLGGSFATLPPAHSTALGKASLRFDPVQGLFGLQVLREEGLLAQPRLREALAMAIDRNQLASAIDSAGTPTGFAPTTRLLPKGLEGALPDDRWSDYDLEGRRALARKRLAEWRSIGKHAALGVPVLRLALPQGPGVNRLADRLKADFAAIGVQLEQVSQKSPADLALVDRVARYPAPAWFFNQLACAITRPCAPELDRLAQQAAAAPPDQRPALYSDAEREFARANLFIPLGQPIRYAIIGPSFGANAQAFSPNRWAQHPLFPLSNRAR